MTKIDHNTEKTDKPDDKMQCNAIRIFLNKVKKTAQLQNNKTMSNWVSNIIICCFNDNQFHAQKK